MANDMLAGYHRMVDAQQEYEEGIARRIVECLRAKESEVFQDLQYTPRAPFIAPRVAVEWFVGEVGLISGGFVPRPAPHATRPPDWRFRRATWLAIVASRVRALGFEEFSGEDMIAADW